MALPFFFHPGLTRETGVFEPDEETARHMVQVLRMKPGDEVRFTDGLGAQARAVIETVRKKSCTVLADTPSVAPAPARRSAMGVSLLRNAARFEWFLEKAAELGIADIYPLLCTRTEKQRVREDRMRNILVSAMLQSQQVWLPRLHEPAAATDLIGRTTAVRKLICHCEAAEKTTLLEALQPPVTDQLLLIGPEGDFTPEEIATAEHAGFTAITLGATRLRAETAAVAAAAAMTLSAFEAAR